ncbi:MAG: PorT family protein [Bacteroidales bacterium]|nr:PorT family protein [Bacteroidales bacterium]
MRHQPVFWLFEFLRIINMRIKLPLIVTLFLLVTSVKNVHAQDDKYHLGFRGGVGMTTISGVENNGLKLGLTGGVCGKYTLSEKTDIVAELNYTMGGLQSTKWITSGENEVKEYRKYTLHYISIPVLYQYYFTDILGLEAGANFSYCFSGSLKKKYGNEQWHSESFSTKNYNTFDFGFILGVYTDNLIPHDNMFVSLRACFGMLDVLKDNGSNKNINILISVGYMLF